jgi:hypothetical protein
MVGPVKLIARDGEDIAVIAALLQDAILPAGDMAWIPQERRFVMIVNRFCWPGSEERGQPAATEEGEALFQRTHCAVRVEGVRAARLRGLDPGERGRLLNILTVTLDGAELRLEFSGGPAVALTLETEQWALLAEDLGETWPTTREPSHDVSSGADGEAGA